MLSRQPLSVIGIAYLTIASADITSRQSGRTPTLSGPPVDITSGQNGTYPRANFLADGSILGAYATVANNTKHLAVTRSTDSGSTWSFLSTVVSRPSASSDLDNPYPLQLPSGRILLAYRNHDRDPVTGVYTTFRITVSCSDDNGASWTDLSTPATEPREPNGLWEPFLRNARNLDDSTSLQLYYSRENAAADQDSLLRTSLDGGETWSAARTISGESATARDGMLGVTRLSGGGEEGQNLLAVFETTTADGTFAIDAVSSPDDGLSWEGRRRIYTPTGSGTNAGAPQVVHVGGTVVVSFMTDEDTRLQDWVNGAGAKMIASGDGGKTWGNKTQVFQPQANWPGMLALNDSSLLYFADHDGAKAQKIVLS